MHFFSRRFKGLSVINPERFQFITLRFRAFFNKIVLFFFLIIQVLHCQTMLISYYSSINTITYTSLIRYQIPFFTPYQSPARGCKAALCTPNPRHEKTYLQGSAPRGGGGVLWYFHTYVGSGHFFFFFFFFFFFVEGGSKFKMQCLQKILVKYSIKINFVFPLPLRQYAGRH